MKAELTVSMLQGAMRSYLEETPDAVLVGDLIWTAPERVCQFAAGLGSALAEVIYEAIPVPVEVVPVEAVVVEAVVVATVEDAVEAEAAEEGEAALLARERELSSRPV